MDRARHVVARHGGPAEALAEDLVARAQAGRVEGCVEDFALGLLVVDEGEVSIVMMVMMMMVMVMVMMVKNESCGL